MERELFDWESWDQHDTMLFGFTDVTLKRDIGSLKAAGHARRDRGRHHASLRCWSHRYPDRGRCWLARGFWQRLGSAVKSTTQTRQQVSAKLRGLEIPSCFAAATVAAAVRASERDTVSARVSRRRLLEKARRVVGAL